jgi:hypothetical protein
VVKKMSDNRQKFEICFGHLARLFDKVDHRSLRGRAQWRNARQKNLAERYATMLWAHGGAQETATIIHSYRAGLI